MGEPRGMKMTRRPRVLFLCTHNAARSQMAEGILRDLSRGTVDTHSAGAEPAGVHPLAVRALWDMDIDITSQALEARGRIRRPAVRRCGDPLRQRPGVVPRLPGDPERIHWSFPDPGAVVGTEEERLQAFKRTAWELATRLRPFLSLAERGVKRSSA